MDWLKNLSDAIEYIEKNLDKDISIEECSKLACCSSFYFQRIFSYIAGISLSEYIRRRRMTQAGFLLKRTDIKIIDIALKYGYSSPSSFTRAFKDVHNITPSNARKHDSILKSYPKIKFSIDIMGDCPISYSIKDLDEFRILSLSIKLTDNMNKNQKIVPLFWSEILDSDRFKKLLDLNPNAKNIFGITEFKSPDNIYYHIGILSNSPKPEFTDECIIPKSTWAIFENEGNFKLDVQNVFKSFYKEWLPFSGYNYGFLPDIEIYPIKKDPNPYGSSKVLISIKKES